MPTMVGTNLVVVRPIPSTATLEEIDDLDAYVELVEVSTFSLVADNGLSF